MSQQPIIQPVQSPSFYLIPPNIDLEHVAKYDDHGKALVELIKAGDIPTLHHPVILGLFAVYSMFIALGIFDESRISFPPHEDFRPQEWLNIGFTEEVVNIMALLPWLLKGEHYEDAPLIAPQSPALSYLGIADDPESFRGPEVSPEVKQIILPEHFCLTSAWARDHNYIYNSKDGVYQFVLAVAKSYLTSKCTGTMLWFDSDDKSIADYTDEDFHWHPAELILNNWVQNLYDLTYAWTPYRFGFADGIQAEPNPNPVDYTTGEPNMWDSVQIQAWIKEPFLPWILREDHLLVELNLFRAMQNLYHQHGWPKQFNRGAFLDARKRFTEEYGRFQQKIQKANPKGFRGTPVTPEEREARQERLAFLQEAAGPLAVKLDTPRWL
jgi:hypothetical protein